MNLFDRNAAPISRPTGERQTVSTSHLQYIVETELARHLQSGTSFTAYSITLALRENFPLLDILHTRVRKIVQTRMAKLALPYRRHMQLHDGTWAMTYVPASVSLTSASVAKGWEHKRSTKADYGTLEPLLLDISTR